MKPLASHICAAVAVSLGVVTLQGQQPALPRADANGNPLRQATKTGHISNYDESKVPSYTLPDPLVFANGSPVRTASDWTTKRRAEVIRLYETAVFG